MHGQGFCTFVGVWHGLVRRPGPVDVQVQDFFFFTSNPIQKGPRSSTGWEPAMDSCGGVCVCQTARRDVIGHRLRSGSSLRSCAPGSAVALTDQRWLQQGSVIQLYSDRYTFQLYSDPIRSSTPAVTPLRITLSKRHSALLLAAASQQSSWTP